MGTSIIRAAKMKGKLIIHVSECHTFTRALKFT